MPTIYIAPTALGGGTGVDAANAYAIASITTAETDAGNGGTIIFKDDAYNIVALNLGSALTTNSITYKATTQRGAIITASGQFKFGNTNLMATLYYDGLVFNSTQAGGDIVIFDQSDVSGSKLNSFSNCDFKAACFLEQNLQATHAWATFTGCIFELAGAIGAAVFWFSQRWGATLIHRANLDFINCTIHNRTHTGTTAAKGIFDRCVIDMKNTIVFDYSDAIVPGAKVVSSQASLNLSGPCNLIQADDSTLLTDSDNIELPPQFVDETAGDFRLRPSSPCINAGA